MGEPAKVTNTPLKDIMRADNSDDDVQVIETIPSKTQKSAIHSISSAQKLTKPTVDADDGPDLEIITTSYNKSPIPYRGTDANKKTSNSTPKAMNNSNRKPEVAKTLTFPHTDDKSIELNISAKNQLNTILNSIDLKPKNPVNAYSDIGNGAFNNQLLLMMMQNQPSIPINNAFALGNMNYGLQQNKISMFPQEYNHFPSLMLFPPDATNHLYGQPNQVFFANNLLNKAPQVNPMCIPIVEDPRGGFLQTHLTASSVQEPPQIRQAVNPKNFSGVPNSENHINQEVSLQKPSVIEEAVELTSPSNVKTAVEDDAAARRKRTRTCFNQCCQTDPMNANLWSKVRVMGKMSCKICEEAWKKQQYCYFCKQVYIEDGEGYSDSKPWIDCDICKRWTHTECEDKQIQREIKLQQEKEDGNVQYSCPSCRTKARGPGRKPRKPLSPAHNEPSYPQRSAPERPTHEDLEQNSMRKQIKVSADPLEEKQKEINGNVAASATVATEENFVARRKLDNMFNKHIQKRKLQVVRPVIGYNSYAIVDALLAQYGKKMQLSEHELHHDLHLMREYAGKNSVTDRGESPEPSNYANDDYNFDEGKKSGPRALRNRGGNSRRGARSEINMSETFDEETASEYTSVTHSKRNTRTRR